MFSSSQIESAAGGGFFSSQSTQFNDSASLSSAKSRDAQPMVPATIKQISDVVQSSDDKSSFLIDGVNVNVILVGMTFNKSEKVTDASFTIDDGTGRIDCHRWINNPVDTKEVEAISDGAYVRVHGHLKSYQEKMKLEVFAIRPVTNFDEVSNHFIACIHYHFYRTKRCKVQYGATVSSPANMPSSTISSGYQTSSLSQSSGIYSLDGLKDIDKKIIEYLEQPSSVEQEKGVHRNEIAQHLKLPLEKIIGAIETLESEGLVYSTIDECHFKSTGSG